MTDTPKPLFHLFCRWWPRSEPAPTCPVLGKVSRITDALERIAVEQDGLRRQIETLTVSLSFARQDIGTLRSGLALHMSREEDEFAKLLESLKEILRQREADHAGT